MSYTFLDYLNFAKKPVEDGNVKPSTLFMTKALWEKIDSSFKDQIGDKPAYKKTTLFGEEVLAVEFVEPDEYEKIVQTNLARYRGQLGHSEAMTEDRSLH